MNIKKLFARAISLVVAASLLSSCGGDGNSSGNDSSGSSASDNGYNANNIESIDIIQKGKDSYEITLESEFGANAEVYLTSTDHFSDDAYKAETTANDDGALVFTLKAEDSRKLMKNSNEIFFWTCLDGEKTSMPVTIPYMDAYTEKNDKGNVVLYFGLDTATSWSSYCDPAGKSVYRSGNTTWDSSAELVTEGINIITPTCTDRNATDSKPYYFVVLTSKNGTVRFISSALVRTEQAFSNVAASVGMSDSGVVLNVTADAVFKDSAYSLKISEVNGEQFTVKNASSESGKVSFSLSLEQITKFGVWYDIVICDDTIGREYEINSASGDGSTQLTDGKRYYLPEWEGILKVCAEEVADGEYTLSSVEFSEVDGEACLVIKGKLNNASFVKLKLNEKFVEASTNGSDFTIVAALSELSEAGKWYDLHLYYTDNDYNDLTVSDANMGNTLSVGDRIYSFKSWENTLKVTFEKAEFVINKVDISTGKLVISGKVSDGKNISVKVGGVKADVKMKDGTFTATYNLGGLLQADKWYDIHVYYAEDSYTDIDITKVSVDMSQKYVDGDKTYSLAEYENCLKVLFTLKGQDIPVEPQRPCTITDVKLELSDYKAYLVIYGTCKNAVNVLVGDAAATVTSKGDNFVAKFALSSLEEADKWYDIHIYYNGTEYTDINIKETDVDMSETVSADNKTYAFAEYDSCLKVYYFDGDGAFNPTNILEIIETVSITYEWTNANNGNVHENGGWYPIITMKGRVPSVISSMKFRFSHDEAEIIKNVEIDANRYATFTFDLTELLKFEDTKTNEWFWIEGIVEYNGVEYKAPVPAELFDSSVGSKSETYGWITHLGTYNKNNGSAINFNFDYSTIEISGFAYKCLHVRFGA